MLKRMCVILIIGFLSGCASTPNIKFSYYPSHSSSNVTVTQTISCNSEQTALIFLYSSTLNTRYSADYSKDPCSIEIKKLDGTFADTDVDFSFFEDGRLKGINESTTGQGETILKSAIALGAAVAPLLGGGAETKEKRPECDVIKKFGDKAVTLTYTKNIEYGKDDDGKPHRLDPDAGSADLYKELNKQNQLHLLDVTITPKANIKNRARFDAPSSGSSDDVVLLKLQETENVMVDVKASGNDIWNGYVIVPGKNSYYLPIPKAALFGKQIFALSLSESGAITEIHYGKNTGAAGLLNAATSAATAAAPESTAAKAADIKAKADLIAQQQRLARCQAQPATCQ